LAVDLSTGIENSIPLDVGEIRGIAFSSDASRVAITGLEALAVIDLATQTVTQQFGIGGVSDALWMSDDSLLVGTIDGRWDQLSLDVQDLVAQARDRLRRSFSEVECELYGIDPCPSLEDIQSR
jgi:hypothetical protein